MKPTLEQMEQLRIACAEVCGFRDVRQANPPSSLWTAIPIIQDHPDHRVIVPAYDTDLNAMREAEKVLTVAQRITYANNIGVILSGGSIGRAIPDWWFIHKVTASERLEAFLRVMKPEMFEIGGEIEKR